LWGLLVPAAAGSLVLAVNLWQSVHRSEKTLAGEILAIAAMSLTAPAAHYVALGRWTAQGWLLWLLSVAYFTSGVLYIKLRIAGMREKHPGQKRLRVLCGGYHLLLLVLLLFAAGLGGLPWLAAAAFGPVLIRGLWGSLGALGRLDLHHAGWLEVAWSLVFLLLAGLAMRAGTL
jgi:hypothetical protein